MAAESAQADDVSEAHLRQRMSFRRVALPIINY